MQEGTSSPDRAKRITSRFIKGKPLSLFVPSPAMLLFHELSKPAAILKRAELPPTKWDEWRRRYADRPWVFGWLYGDVLPLGIELHYWCWARRGTQSPLDAFAPEPEMKAFREEATGNAVSRAVKRTIKRRTTTTRLKRNADHHSPGKMLRRHRDLPWFRSWLFRGENPPADIRVTTLGQLHRARAAWDHIAHLQSARAQDDNRGLADGAYHKWFYGNLLPDGDLREPFVKWLYGGPAPKGWTIISSRMTILRSQSTVDGINKAAAVVLHPPRDNGETVALQAARDAASAHVRADPPEHLPAWTALDQRQRRTYWAFAKAATIAARCARARINRQDYDGWLREAKKKSGAKAAAILKRYLDGAITATDGTNFRKRGTLEGDKGRGLFLPAEGMEEFRRIAQAAISREQIASLMSELPCAQEWMQVETAPCKPVASNRGALHGRKGQPPKLRLFPVVRRARPEPMASAASFGIEQQERLIPIVELSRLGDETMKQLAWLMKDSHQATPPQSLPTRCLSWPEIMATLGRSDDSAERRRIARLNKELEGPINIRARGTPSVLTATLSDWWRDLEKKFTEREERKRNTKATVATQHNYGREGTVAPEISGHLKSKRKI